MKRTSIAAALALVLLLASGGPARAVDQVPVGTATGGSQVTVDVWINKEEGGVYRPGESMRVFFRTSADAHVLVYNIDTDGYIHLVYPYGPADQDRVEGGRTYAIPARHDPYELVADGPPGMEFVVAIASRLPFQNLPWYLSNGPADAERVGSDDELESGVIVGDPYVGMERINQRIIPPAGETDSDASEIYFYIEKRVEYPRYVCADCHYPSYAFDPYLSTCSVVDIRIDATWVRYAPVHVGVARPRYYYWVRPGAPNRYRAWKERWSSIDGGSTLRTRFVVERSSKTVKTRDVKTRSTPPEFKDLRRTRPGRLWQGRDEVLRLWEQQSRERRGQPSTPEVRSGKGRPSPGRPAPDRQQVERKAERPKDESQSGNRDRGKVRDSGEKNAPRDGGGSSQPRDKGQDQPKERSREQESPPQKQSPAPKTDTEHRERSR